MTQCNAQCAVQPVNQKGQGHSAFFCLLSGRGFYFQLQYGTRNGISVHKCGRLLTEQPSKEDKKKSLNVTEDKLTNMWMFVCFLLVCLLCFFVLFCFLADRLHCPVSIEISH